MDKTKFNERYAQLNPAQKEAVDAIEGPVMVVAGPGTGKTEILTLRIANILLKTQVSPKNILALTFTESAVSSMRSRLFEIIGSAAYRVPIHTFHSFCNDVIRRFPEFFPRIVGSQNITEIEQIQILERVFSEISGIDKLRPAGDPLYYVRYAKSAISTLKREGISVGAFAEIVVRARKDFENIPDLRHDKGAHKGKMKGKYAREEGMLAKNEALAEVFRAYEETLASERLYDFDDMIAEVSRAAEKDPDFLLMLQEEYQYVLVDEHQDTNRAQNTVLSLLMNFHSAPNIFIVGDTKQAIFRFQGASEANFAHFRAQYPSAREIVLEENYRSTQTILDAAWSVIKKEKLKAKAGHEEKPVSVYACASQESEEFFVAHEIAERIASGVPPESIAVLYRDNKDARGIARALSKYGVPYFVFGEEDVFSDAEMRKLLAFFRAVDSFGAQDLFIEALHADFLKVPPLAVYELAAFAKKRKQSVFASLRDESLKEFCGEGHVSSLSRASALFETLATKAKNETFFDFFDSAIRESGFLAHLLSLPDSLARIESLVSLFESAREFGARKEHFMLRDFIGFIDSMKEHGVRVRRSGRSFPRHSVRIQTAHKSKGAEFDYVYLLGATDGHWGGRDAREKLALVPGVYSVFSERAERDEDEDERRLFFVALTRARKHAAISYAKVAANGKALFPSRFVSEIDEACVERSAPVEFEKSLEEHPEKAFAESKVTSFDAKTKEFIASLFDEYGLSVTGLNNYLSCPWKYFYMNLLRIPKVQEGYLLFGTAVHAALHDFFEARAKREVPDSFLTESFELHLRRQDLSERELGEFLARGEKALSGFAREAVAYPLRSGKNEFEIGRAMLDGIPLTGKIDRMEFLGDTKKVHVIDYKTGKPKSRNDILGETSASEGNMIRQLLFYKLLLSCYEKGIYTVASGEIDFVEPTEAGAYRREQFDLSDGDVADLSKEVMRVAAEIRNLAFWSRFCGDPECEYCAVRRMME